MEFGPSAGTVAAAREIAVHLGLGDLNAVHHLAIAQARYQDFGAQIFAKLCERHAIAGQDFAQLLQRQVVLFSDIANRLRHGLVVDAQSLAFGGAHLQFAHDQPLQRLANQVLLRRYAGANAPYVLIEARCFGLQLAQDHDIVIDHGNDAFQQFFGVHTGRGAGCQYPSQQHTGSAFLSLSRHFLPGIRICLVPASCRYRCPGCPARSTPAAA